jgi:hypothetical protein
MILWELLFSSRGSGLEVPENRADGQRRWDWQTAGSRQQTAGSELTGLFPRVDWYPLGFAILGHAYESKGHSGVRGIGLPGKNMISKRLPQPFVLL